MTTLKRIRGDWVAHEYHNSNLFVLRACIHSFHLTPLLGEDASLPPPEGEGWGEGCALPPPEGEGWGGGCGPPPDFPPLGWGGS